MLRHLTTSSRVYEVLEKLPKGETFTYTKITNMIINDGDDRAKLGMQVSANLVSIEKMGAIEKAGVQEGVNRRKLHLYRIVDLSVWRVQKRVHCPETKVQPERVMKRAVPDPIKLGETHAITPNGDLVRMTPEHFTPPPPEPTPQQPRTLQSLSTEDLLRRMHAILRELEFRERLAHDRVHLEKATDEELLRELDRRTKR